MLEYQDGSFSQISPEKEALNQAIKELSTGLVKALHFGSQEELQEHKNLNELVKDIQTAQQEQKERLSRLESQAGIGVITIPTQKQINEFLK